MTARRMLIDLVELIIAFALIVALCAVSAPDASAHGVIVTRHRSAAPISWPCRQAGWNVGDRWGPGPLDIVPDVPLCRAAGLLTPPPTDTNP